MAAFRRILIDESIADTEIVKILLKQTKSLWTVITRKETKERLNGEMKDASSPKRAKKSLLLTSNPGSFFKPMDCECATFDPDRKSKWRFELWQGCPADCHYCFCQCYLQCQHPVVYVNIDAAVEEARKTDFKEGTCLVTGDIADSLALGRTSIYLHETLSRLMPEFTWELRSKFPLPAGWESLDRKKFRFDWSLSPAGQIKENEPGTASLKCRIESLAQVYHAGFKTAVRFDPIQPDAAVSAQYLTVIRYLNRYLESSADLRFVLGSYKVNQTLLNGIREKHPKSNLNRIEWVRGKDGKLRPFRQTRLSSYKRLIQMIESYYPNASIELSMESDWVWDCLKISRH